MIWLLYFLFWECIMSDAITEPEVKSPAPNKAEEMLTALKQMLKTAWGSNKTE